MAAKYYLSTIGKAPTLILPLFLLSLPLIKYFDLQFLDDPVNLAVIGIILSFLMKPLKIPSLEISDHEINIIILIFPFSRGRYLWSDIVDIKEVHIPLNFNRPVFKLAVQTPKGKIKEISINSIVIEKPEQLINKFRAMIKGN